MRRVGALLVAALLAVLLAGALAGCDKDAPAHSARLPKVTLQGFQGQPDVALGTLKGPAVVNLWASWCGPCKRELPLYADFARSYSGKVRVLGIDFQETSQTRARALARKSHVTYSLVSDPDGALRAHFLPKLILVNEKGEIAFQEYVEIKSAAQLEALVAKHLGVARP